MTNAAANVIRDRVQGMVSFKGAKHELVERSVRTIGTPTVAGMKELGGFTVVLHRTLDVMVAENPTLRDNVGSEMLTWSVHDELRLLIPTLRVEVQKRVS